MAEKVEVKGRAFDWYLAHPIATLRDVAEEFSIPYETVRDWAKGEGWVNKRVINENMDVDKMTAQAAGIRDVIYEEIVFTDDTRGLPDLVKAWKSLTDVLPTKREEDSFDRDTILDSLNETD